MPPVVAPIAPTAPARPPPADSSQAFSAGEAVVVAARRGRGGTSHQPQASGGELFQAGVARTGLFCASLDLDLVPLNRS